MRPRVRRLLSHLALAAIFSLATLPTLGRLALSSHMPSRAMAMDGHAMPSAPGSMPDRSPCPQGHGEDCAYCVLVSGALPSAALSLNVATVPLAPWVWGDRRQLPVAHDAGSGLGARGPPRDC